MYRETSGAGLVVAHFSLRRSTGSFREKGDMFVFVTADFQTSTYPPLEQLLHIDRRPIERNLTQEPIHMHAQPLEVREARALEVRLDQVARRLPARPIRRAHAAAREGGDGAVADADGLDGKAVPVRGRQRLHVLGGRAVHHPVAQEVGRPGPAWAPGGVGFRLEREEAVLAQRVHHRRHVVEPQQPVPARVARERGASELDTCALVLEVLDGGMADPADDGK